MGVFLKLLKNSLQNWNHNSDVEKHDNKFLCEAIVITYLIYHMI